MEKTSQKGFNQLPEMGAEVVKWPDSKDGIDSRKPTVRELINAGYLNEPVHYEQSPFPELKFKNGDFEK